MYVIWAESFHIRRSPEQPLLSELGKIFFPKGSGTLQRQPVGGLQELTHDGMPGRLSCVGPDRFEPSMALSQAIEGTYVSMADPLVIRAADWTSGLGPKSPSS